jgi:hypothetical protein
VGEPIDMQQTDLALPAAGLPLVFQRTHLSSYRAGLCFGPTWISTLDEVVQIDGEGVVFTAADGMRLVYPTPASGTRSCRRRARAGRWSGTVSRTVS